MIVSETNRMRDFASMLHLRLLSLVQLQLRSILALQSSDFQPFSSHSAHKLLLKFCGTPKKYIVLFANLTKIVLILIHSHRTAIVVLAAVILVFDNLREKRSGVHALNILTAHR